MQLARLSLVLSLLFGTTALALDNASFESTGTPDPWRALSDMRDGKGSMKVVQDAHHEGEQSLLLTGQDGSEVVAAQTVTLPGGSLWRVRCWIKTKDMGDAKAKESEAGESDEVPGATVQIRAMDDSVAAEAQGSASMPDWQEVDSVFRVPVGGRFLLALVLKSPAKGEGQAWFDDLHLDRLEDAKFEQHVLNFPILWVRSAPYNKMLPKDVSGHCGTWYCSQMAAAQLVRYWSMKTKLRCSGTYWYQRRDNKEIIRIDYGAPFHWERMAPSLTRLPYTDPRVDPVADFVFRFTAAQRAQWPAVTGGHYYWTRNIREAFTKYFGFDSSSLRYVQFGEFLKTHSWNDLCDILRKEIDEGRPVYLTLSGTKSGRHAVIITGYRKVADQTEFTFHWGWHGAYNPSQTFRLDKPIRDFDTPTNHDMFIGIKPDTTHEQLPLYNKIAEQWDSDYEVPAAHSDLAWNGDRGEYAAVFPAGPKTAQQLYYQRISAGGLPASKSFPLEIRGNCRKPVMAWSGSVYGLAWEDRTDKTGTIWFARIAPEDGMVKDPAPIRVGQGSPDGWRPTVTIVYNGSEFALAWSENGTLQFLKIPASGSPKPEDKKTLVEGIDPHLVWLGEGYALAFSAGGTVQLARLDPDGKILGSAQKIFPQPNRGVYTPRVCWSGSQFGVAWEFIGRDHWHHVCFARADAQCKPIEGSLVMVSDFDAPTRRALNPAVSYHKNEFILTYCKDDAYLARLSDEGKILENRFLFWTPAYVTHVVHGDAANVLYLHTHGSERSVEVESCLFPLGK